MKTAAAECSLQLFDFVEFINWSTFMLYFHFTQKYFSSLKSITLTTLDILNDRIFPHHAKNYLDWNVFPNVRSPLFLKQV
jgi:hypothetical protein